MKNGETSEQWHNEIYGDPISCYQEYLRIRSLYPEIFSGKSFRNPDMLVGKACDIAKHWYDKWITITFLYPLHKSRHVLDLGSNGSSNVFLLQFVPTIEKIIAIDGDKEAIQVYAPFLDDRITVIAHDFYDY